jgi:hypothetical protein
MYCQNTACKDWQLNWSINMPRQNRNRLILTCLDAKVKMYEKMGFVDQGLANSTWGGEE